MTNMTRWVCDGTAGLSASGAWPGLPLVALLLLPALSCGFDLPQGTAVNDPDLMALLRPKEGVSEERLIRAPEGHGYYLAHLRGLHSSGYVEEYLDQLDERGVTVEASADSSPHTEVVPHVLGYRFRAVQEAALKPYTIRYRRGWDGRERDAERKDHPHPIKLSGRWLIFRLPQGFLEPWTTAVLVPEKSVAKPPFPFPLPPDAILLAAEDEYRTQWTPGGFVREATSSGLVFSFLSKAPPAEVIAFYRRAMEAGGAKTRGETRLVADFSGTPDWAPRPVKWVAVDEDGDLFVAEGLSVRTGPHAVFVPRRENPRGQLKSLRNVPMDVRRYKVGITFVPVKPE